MSSVAGFDEMEIRIFKVSRTTFSGDVRLPDGQRFSTRLPAETLRQFKGGMPPEEYGARLFEWLFQGEVGDIFARASNLVQVPTRSVLPDLGLRIRLWLDPDARELHRLNWESIWKPNTFRPVTLQTAFSRFLRTSAPQMATASDRPVHMLLVIANPTDSPMFENVEDTITIIKKTIASGYSRFIERLDLQIAEGGPTLDLLEKAGEQDYRVIHLLARSIRREDENAMILTGEGGHSQLVPYPVVARVMSRFSEKLPAFMFVSAPLPPDTPREDVEDFLGPKLTESGAQAVLSVETPMNPDALMIFTEEFYRVLSATGVVDEAAARARLKIFKPDRWDWSAPVLYTRAQETIQIFQQVSNEAIFQSIEGLNFEEKGV